MTTRRWGILLAAAVVVLLPTLLAGAGLQRQVGPAETLSALVVLVVLGVLFLTWGRRGPRGNDP